MTSQKELALESLIFPAGKDKTSMHIDPTIITLTHKVGAYINAQAKL